MHERAARLTEEAVRAPVDAGTDDATLARTLARGAGALLLRLRSEPGATDDPKALRPAADKASNRYLLDALARARPDDAVLSEESPDAPEARRAASRVWIVDPLDGTREYGEPPREDWAVHVALWAGDRLTAGAVALPGRDEVLTADAPPPVPARPAGPLRLAVSRTRPPAFLDELSARLDVTTVPLGSAGFKVSAVVLGTVDAYVHTGGQYEWDSAAPVAVAAGAGLYTSRADGSPLVYNGPDPWLPDLVVCRPELADDLMRALDGLV
ncbi:MAG: 3'(2'),5'-bisphosphate nucleotidase CysQ [Actinomycetes bacterium]